MAATNFWIPQGGKSDFIGAKVGQHLEYTVQRWLPTSEYGAVGNVWTAVTADGQWVVVKTPKDPRSDGWLKELRGADFAQRVPHENLMGVLFVGEQPCPIPNTGGKILGAAGQSLTFIIIEHCTEMDMFSYCERAPFSKDLAKHYFIQLAKGINCLHEHAGAHRDLKPDNLLLSRLLTLKIGDFGFARALDTTEFTAAVGTAIYNSPEMQHGRGHVAGLNPRAQDVWMMGTCLFVFLTNSFPFEGDQPRDTYFNALDAPDSPAYPPTHNNYWKGRFTLKGKRPFDLKQKFIGDGALLDLINRMWDRNIDRRITAQQILEHPWLTTNDDGTPYIPYDMGADVMTFVKGGPCGTLLSEMCSKMAPGAVKKMLETANAFYAR